MTFGFCFCLVFVCLFVFAVYFARNLHLLIGAQKSRLLGGNIPE